MDIELLRQNLLSPPVLAFALGIVAALVKSDLSFPKGVYSLLSTYLLLAIGMKGGAALAITDAGDVWRPALATLVLGVVCPLIAYGTARYWGRLAVADAASLAAHYGSVSAVTFIAATTFTTAAGVPAPGFMPALVALLEVPAIIIALVIARRATETTNAEADSGHRPSLWAGIHEVITGKSVVLLVGGLLIGLFSGPNGIAQVKPLFLDPFQGVLVFFLLEMGLLVAPQLAELRRAGVFLLLFGLLVPLLHGVLGVWLGNIAGLDVGGQTVFAAMAASASYIAAPAAVRIALPQANLPMSLAAALGLTFPFNLTLGLPLFYALAQVLG
jgi:uncharacterized protein